MNLSLHPHYCWASLMRSRLTMFEDESDCNSSEWIHRVLQHIVPTYVGKPKDDLKSIYVAESHHTILTPFSYLAVLSTDSPFKLCGLL